MNTIDVQEKQKDITYYINDEYLKQLEKSWCSSSLFDEDSGKCLFCGGIADMGLGRGLAWTLLSSSSNRYLSRITRYLGKQLNAAPFRRIEAIVDGDFEQAHRWMKMLGFQCETPNGMKDYYEKDLYSYLYSRY